MAARSLGLSQPTVHRTARNLEAVAGLPFFIARPSGVHLTGRSRCFHAGGQIGTK
jgi:DNA-binding transcriptional LysR family regulator